jgi:hypothetical protein
MEQAGMDFAYVSGYDGFYGMTRDVVTLKRDEWDSATLKSVTQWLHDSGQDVGAKFGDSSRMNNPTNFTYGFKTRDGGVGLLQITTLTENPSGVKLRYKRFEPSAAGTTNSGPPTAAEARKLSLEALAERLDAASSMMNSAE